MPKTEIAIGLGTFKRPEMVKKALQSLAKLTIPEGAKISVLLIDNNAEPKKERLVPELSAIPFQTYYFHEEMQGIVHVRNRILKEASALNINYLAMTDDDVEVSPSWIVDLISALTGFHAKAVEGKVMYKLPVQSPPWLKRRDFYGKEARKTGQIITSASTNNVFFDLDFVNQKKIRFDERLNDCGSSDTHFFTQLRQLGGKIVWSEEAIVHESVPLSKANKAWIFSRAYKSGYTTLKRYEISFGRLNARLIVLPHIVALFTWVVLNQFRMPPFSKSNRMFTFRKFAEIKGSFDWIRGKTLRSYAQIHGK